MPSRTKRAATPRCIQSRLKMLGRSVQRRWRCCWWRSSMRVQFGCCIFLCFFLQAVDSHRPATESPFSLTPHCDCNSSCQPAHCVDWWRDWDVCRAKTECILLALVTFNSKAINNFLLAEWRKQIYNMHILKCYFLITSWWQIWMTTSSFFTFFNCFFF